LGKFEYLPEPNNSDTIRFFAKSNKEDIGFINFIFDSYEGIGNIRTLNENSGILEFRIAPDFLEEAEKLFEDFRKKISFHLISEEEAGPY